MTVKELAWQRYSFILQLILAAGYSGWVLLVDEVELIGRYSIKQRARSYAEIARLMGKLEGIQPHRIELCFNDFRRFRIGSMDYRNDEEKIPAKFSQSNHPDEVLMASQAETRNANNPPQ